MKLACVQNRKVVVQVQDAMDDIPLKTRFPDLKPPAPVSLDDNRSKPNDTTATTTAPVKTSTRPLTITLPPMSSRKPLRSVTDILRDLKAQSKDASPAPSAPPARFGGGEVAYTPSAIQAEAISFASALADSNLPTQPSPTSLTPASGASGMPDTTPVVPPSQPPTNQHD